MKIYLAGPMRGRPQFNFPAFDEAAKDLRRMGHEVFSPADNDRENGFDPSGMTGNEDLAAHGFNLRDALGADVGWIAAHAEAVAVLDGWENSSGARAEVALAHALGLPVAPHADFWSNGPQDALITPTTPPSGTITAGGETRTTSSTGGQKGTKPERYDLIPVEALTQVARLYGRGAAKYAAHNWRRGYEWSKSYAAMQRHANQFWAGEDIDEEMGLPHLASVVFHAFTLMIFMREHQGFDDRFKPVLTGQDTDA